MIKALAIFILSCFTVAPAFAASSVIWKVTQSWTPAWEQKYAVWVFRELDAEFFNRYGIETDCADVAVASRWIFARNNGLPAANTLIGSGVLFTQDSLRPEWRNLPRSSDWSKDQVFRAALEYVLVYTDTQTVWRDSYPVAINVQNFLPGVHHMEFRANGDGHTQLVNAVDLSQQSAEVGVLESTVPRELRVLFAIAFDQAEQPKSTDGGLLRFRWPEKTFGQWHLRSATQMPGYSTEQYGANFVAGSAGFSVAVKKRLTSTYDPYLDFQTAVGNMRALLQKRVDIVNEGFAACQRIDCSPLSAGWEEWSTPDRDSRLYDLDLLLNRMRDQNQADARFEAYWNQFLAMTEITIDGAPESYTTLMLEVDSNNLSPEPRDSIRKRWGLE